MGKGGDSRIAPTAPLPALMVNPFHPSDPLFFPLEHGLLG